MLHSLSAGEKVLILRRRQGRTQHQLAAVAGISRATINALETGRVPSPTRELISRIAAALSVGETDLAESAEAPRIR